MKTSTSRLGTLTKVVLGVAVLVWLLWSVETQRIVAAFRASDPRNLWGGVALLGLSTLVQVVRLQILLRDFQAGFARSFRLTFGGFLFNQLLPGGMGGEGYRILEVRRLSTGWVSAVGLITLERATGFLCLALPGLLFAANDSERLLSLRTTLASWDIAARMPGEQALWFLTAPGLVLLAFFLWLAVRHREAVAQRLRHLVADLRTTFASLGASGYGLIVACSLAYHGVQILAIHCLLRSFGANVEWRGVTVVLALVMVVSLLPLSLGALGVKEGAFVFALALYGVEASDGLAVALVNRLSLVAAAIVGAVVILVSGGRPVTKPPPETPTGANRGGGGDPSGSRPRG